MFTGIVEELGTVTSIKKQGSGLTVVITARKILKDLAVDNSISVNGVCLTVVRRKQNGFSVNIVDETLRKTNLGKIRDGGKVNLERSVRLRDRLSGHLVLGHVDTTGKVKEIKEVHGSWLFQVSIPAAKQKYIIPVGSIAVDGVSLTVARIKKNIVVIAIIPYTYKHTLFGTYSVGSVVNLEFDVLGKYVESLLLFRKK